MSYDPDKCGYCRKRGQACVKHGGIRAGSAAYRNRGDPDGNLDKPLPPTPAHFSNPYDCSMCGRKGSLCDMHERFQRDNQPKPQPSTDLPKTSPTGTPPEVKTTEQTVGQFRVVQIKVGEVIITIKEPIK